MLSPIDYSRFETALHSPRGLSEMVVVLLCVGVAWLLDRRLEARARARTHVSHRHLRGGMGRIVIARDRRLRRPVALKELFAVNRPESVRRFEREALITAKLQHPSIVRLYEAGRLPTLAQVKDAVARDWGEEKRKANEQQRFDALLAHYHVVIEAPSKAVAAQ